MISSLSPSPKYTFAGSELILTNGRTASERAAGTVASRTRATSRSKPERVPAQSSRPQRHNSASATFSTTSTRSVHGRPASTPHSPAFQELALAFPSAEARRPPASRFRWSRRARGRHAGGLRHPARPGLDPKPFREGSDGRVGFRFELLSQQGFVDPGVPECTRVVPGGIQRSHEAQCHASTIWIVRRQPSRPLLRRGVIILGLAPLGEGFQRARITLGEPGPLAVEPLLELTPVRQVENPSSGGPVNDSTARSSAPSSSSRSKVPTSLVTTSAFRTRSLPVDRTTSAPSAERTR